MGTAQRCSLHRQSLGRAELPHLNPNSFTGLAPLRQGLVSQQDNSWTPVGWREDFGQPTMAKVPLLCARWLLRSLRPPKGSPRLWNWLHLPHLDATWSKLIPVPGSFSGRASQIAIPWSVVAGSYQRTASELMWCCDSVLRRPTAIGVTDTFEWGNWKSNFIWTVTLGTCF